MCHEDIVKVITGVEDPEEVEEEAREVIKVTKNQAIVASLLTFIEQRDSDVVVESSLVSKIKSLRREIHTAIINAKQQTSFFC